MPLPGLIPRKCLLLAHYPQDLPNSVFKRAGKTFHLTQRPMCFGNFPAQASGPSGLSSRQLHARLLRLWNGPEMLQGAGSAVEVFADVSVLQSRAAMETVKQSSAPLHTLLKGHEVPWAQPPQPTSQHLMAFARAVPSAQIALPSLPTSSPFSFRVSVQTSPPQRLVGLPDQSCPIFSQLFPCASRFHS